MTQRNTVFGMNQITQIQFHHYKGFKNTRVRLVSNNEKNNSDLK